MTFLPEYLKTNYPVPEEFSTMCFYKEKWFRHDFGNYSEIVRMYNERILSAWDENEPVRFNRFWEWFNEIEEVDLETETLTRAIKASYADTIKAADEKY